MDNIEQRIVKMTKMNRRLEISVHWVEGKCTYRATVFEGSIAEPRQTVVRMWEVPGSTCGYPEDDNGMEALLGQISLVDAIDRVEGRQ